MRKQTIDKKMKDLKIKGTMDSPEVSFTPATNVILFEGRSLQEDPQAFYSVIIDWLKSNILGSKNLIHFQFKMDYFNSSSSRYLMKILMMLNEEPEWYQMTWYVEEGDEVILEKGEEYQQLLDFPVNIIEY